MKNPNRVRAGRQATAKQWPRTCPHCGVPFLGTAKQKYCTRQCKEQSAAATREPKTCGWCGADIPAAIGRQKYCSDACRKKGRFPRAKMRKCAVCPKGFVPSRGRTKKLTCSATCRTIQQSRKRLLTRRPELATAEVAAELERRSHGNPDPGGATG